MNQDRECVNCDTKISVSVCPYCGVCQLCNSITHWKDGAYYAQRLGKHADDCLVPLAIVCADA